MTSGETLLAKTVEHSVAVLGARLSAVFALGSLAHGGFSSLVSDVDAALILCGGVCAGDAQLIDTVTERIRSSGLPLADRISIFWSSWDELATNCDPAGRFPACDRIDFARCGRLLWGNDSVQRVQIPRPNKQTLITEGARFALAKLATHEGSSKLCNTPLLVALGARAVTKAVLFPVRFVYTAKTGEVGTNGEAAEFWVHNLNDAPARDLVETAFRWRTDFVPETAARLLASELLSVYERFIGEYRALLTEYCEVELVGALGKWAQHLKALGDARKNS